MDLVVHKLTGGWPANPKLIEAWLAARKAPPEAGVIAAEQRRVQADLEIEEAHAVVFWRDPNTGEPCYESRAFKAALKEGANVLKKVLDVANFRSKLAERVFVDPRVGGCPIRCECGFPERHGQLLHVEERPIQVMTMRGPRTSIKRVEFARNVTLNFRLRVLRDELVTGEQLRTILEYAQDGGIGADRSQGSGTFDLIEFEQLG